MDGQNQSRQCLRSAVAAAASVEAEVSAVAGTEEASVAASVDEGASGEALTATEVEEVAVSEAVATISVAVQEEGLAAEDSGTCFTTV